MPDDGKLHKDSVTGSHARALLQDEVLQGIFAELKRAYAEKLLATATHQAQEREILYQAHRIVGEVERQLQWIADNGKMADYELNAMLKAQEPKRAFGH